MTFPSISSPHLILPLLLVSVSLVSAFYYFRRRQSPPLDPNQPTAQELAKHQFHHLPALKNTYFTVRHAESTANELGKISSLPAENVANFGLTARGRSQASQTATELQAKIELRSPVLVVSSDFLRARETADILHSRLRIRNPVIYRAELRERQFGALDGKETGCYQQVWNADYWDANQTEFGVESVCSVVHRTTGLIVDMESQYSGHTILLVCHGDTAQILESAFRLISPKYHHSNIKFIKNAEARKMEWKISRREKKSVHREKEEDS